MLLPFIVVHVLLADIFNFAVVLFPHLTGFIGEREYKK